MSILRACLISVSSLAVMVVAAETQTYRYDVHGRLIAVTRASTAATRATTYGLDDANNRIGRTTATGSVLTATGETASPSIDSVKSSEDEGASSPEPPYSAPNNWGGE